MSQTPDRQETMAKLQMTRITQIATPPPEKSEEKLIARGRQYGSKEIVNLLTPPRSRSAARDGCRYTLKYDHQNPNIISNEFQTEILMPEPYQPSSFDYSLRHGLTSLYRNKKQNEQRSFVHRILSGKIPAQILYLQPHKSKQNLSSNFHVELTPRAPDGPVVSNLDASFDIARELLENNDVFGDELMEGLDEGQINECLKFMIESKVRTELRDSIWYNHQYGNRFISIQEYRKWKWLDAACDSRRVREERWRDLVNEFLVWILVCRIAWGYFGGDDFLRNLPIKDFVLEWQDIQYEIKVIVEDVDMDVTA